MAALRERISISSLHNKQTDVPGTRVDLDGVGVGNKHFDIAFDKVKPSVSNKVCGYQSTVSVETIVCILIVMTRLIVISELVNAAWEIDTTRLGKKK